MNIFNVRNEKMMLRPIFGLIIGNCSQVLLLIVALMVSGCIKKAPLNIEADIVSVEYKEEDFFSPPVITNDEVKLFVNDQIDITAYPFTFKLSRGASSIPESGSIQDFSSPMIYTITSEDGVFSKEYTVTITDERVTFIPLEYNFENYSIDAHYKYTQFYDIIQGSKLDTWDSGNAGFVFSIPPITKKQPHLYPMQYTPDSHSGETAVKLETKSTGVFGAGAKKPIAAGNIFLGEFDASNVMGDPLESTHFGRPIQAAPVSFSGFYHYSPGETVIDHNSHAVDAKDSCSLVAVLYDAHDLRTRSNVEYLDGSNLLTEESVVATATLYDGEQNPSAAYKPFDIPFEYRKQPEAESFVLGRYRLAIVLSSSKNGDRFMGAVGSVLLLDDLSITTK